MFRTLFVTSALFAALLTTGCGEEDKVSAPGVSIDDIDWLLDSAPSGAVDVAAVKASAAEGDRVVVRGQIGGRKEPISGESGVFIIMDPAVPACSDIPGDMCTTPWDYCCETPQSITANAATIQLRDELGIPISFGSDALTPLDTVVVSGTVGPRPNNETLVIYAYGVYVTPNASLPESRLSDG